MTMSARERRVLRCIELDLSATDPPLATALRTFRPPRSRLRGSVTSSTDAERAHLRMLAAFVVAWVAWIAFVLTLGAPVEGRCAAGASSAAAAECTLQVGP